MHEAAAHDDQARTLAITLLRGFHRPFGTDGEPGGQILGEHAFTYAIAPLSGAAELGRTLALRDQLATSVRTCQSDDGFGLMQRAASLLHIGGEGVRLSALKPAADGRGVILRLYNPLKTATTAVVTPGFPFKSVMAVNGNEEDGQPTPIKGQRFEVAMPAKRIVSVRLQA